MNRCPICKKAAISIGRRIFISDSDSIICKQCGSNLVLPRWYKTYNYLRLLVFLLISGTFEGIIELVYHIPFHDYFVYRVIFIVFLVILMFITDYLIVPLKIDYNNAN